VTVAAREELRPIEVAKADIENKSVIYPDILIKAQPRTSKTSYLLKNFLSKGCCFGIIIWLRLRIATVAAMFITPLTSAVILNAQAKERLVVAPRMRNAKRRPILEPADEIPFARERRWWNHWERMAMEGM
jgi:hypothetical protein